MAREIYVGKNVVRIHNREFPIDTTLTLLHKAPTNEAAWKVNIAKEKHPFTPMKDGEVTAEAFRTYNHALAQAVTSRKSKLRKLLGHKHEGTKIIPGHGVFILPANMVTVQHGQREVGIRVFGGTSIQKEFLHSDYHQMVSDASDYYDRHFKDHHDEMNESLWHALKYQAREEVREYRGVILPQGVYVYVRDSGDNVMYTSPATNQTTYAGIAHNLTELKSLVSNAEQTRLEEMRAKRPYRHVIPTFITLSSYMRKL